MKVAALPESMRSKVVEFCDCWIWTGARNSKGYGSMTNGQGGSQLAHRTSYELLVGPIPLGLTIDHLCLVKPCVNPHHLEPVSNAENARRKAALITHCRHGHEFTVDNTYFSQREGSGLKRECRACRRSQMARSRARRFRADDIDRLLEAGAAS